MKTMHTEQQSFHVSHQQLVAFVREIMGKSSGREDDEHPLPPGPWDPVIRIALQQMFIFGPHPDPWKVFGPGPQPWRIIEPVFGPVPDPWRVFGPQPEPWRVYGPGVPWRIIESVFGPLPDPWKPIFASIAARHPEIFDIIGGGHHFGDEVALNPQPLPPRFAFMASLAQTVIGRAELFQEIADATRREGEQRGIIIVGGYIARFVDDFCGNDFRFKWPFPWPRPNWFAGEVSGIDLVVMATQFDQAGNETFHPELRQNLADASARFMEAGLSKMQEVQ